MLKEALTLHKEELQLTQQQLLLLEHLEKNKNNAFLPVIYAITPTYTRYVQKAELTRISQTLKLVPNIHWIVVEDSEEKTDIVRNIILESKIFVTHLNAKTPPFEKLKDKVILAFHSLCLKLIGKLIHCLNIQLLRYFIITLNSFY